MITDSGDLCQGCAATSMFGPPREGETPARDVVREPSGLPTRERPRRPFRESGFAPDRYAALSEEVVRREGRAGERQRQGPARCGSEVAKCEVEPVSRRGVCNGVP